MSASFTQLGATDSSVRHNVPTRKATNSPHRNDICCIFVHAGAGYHSIANERIHLEACNDAAKMAMLVLRNGGSALDAAETAVKILEDREITNAGFGSNLSMDGVVECDASVVDHHGRSGAVGAVFKIKNPVSLARLVHSQTMESLTLRRVPPNLLVGQGALDFAREIGIPELPYDAMISPVAHERWSRWRSDLKGAARKAKDAGQHPSLWSIDQRNSQADEAEQMRIRHEHTNSLLQNPSTPLEPDDSPHDFMPPSDSSVNTPGNGESATSYYTEEAAVAKPQTIAESSRSAFINSSQKVPTISQFQDRAVAKDKRIHNAERSSTPARRSWDGSAEESDSAASVLTATPTEATADVFRGIHLSTVSSSQPMKPPNLALEEDHITDTVGAIAIDGWGNIACAASSGGIGMKHRGRVGPAALVGVGAAVVPIDPDDPDYTCVGTVASGTGEHMATTMAATVCAERLYQSVKKGKGGEYVSVTEDEALKSMIEKEFMGHPSVKNSKSAGAIGILGLKKSRHGVMLYYGHNTDSFAMASMHSDEEEPWCAMSRSNGNGSIAQGGRMLRYQRTKRTKTSHSSRPQPY